jgi:hypothetical protein
MDVQASAIGRSLSRRTCYLVTGLVATLAITIGPSVGSAAAATPEKTDVMFIFDTSGSMSAELGEAKEKVLSVIEHVQATVPNVAFGVANVEDIPHFENGTVEPVLSEEQYAEDDEKPWRLDQPVTTEQSKAVSAIDGLTIGSTGDGGTEGEDGGDAPEAYSRALWETDTNPTVGWRADTHHEIVLVADNVPHDPNLNEGLPESEWAANEETGLVENPFDTHEEPPGKLGIPGTVWAPGVDLGIQTVATELGTDGKPLESVEFYGAEDGYLHYWEYWAGLSGGEALDGNSGELETELISAIETGATKPLPGCPFGQTRNSEGICAVSLPCATTAMPTESSPHDPSQPPTALTPRFNQSGTPVVLTPPSGTEFCSGQEPDLGGGIVHAGAGSGLNVTSSQVTFNVPAESGNELALTDVHGQPPPGQPGLGASWVQYGVDDFRYPWGFSIANAPGTGGGETYDENSDIITNEDLESVFRILHFLSLRESAVYEEARQDAESILSDGLCYGFTISSWELYLDAHGQNRPLGWASSNDFSLTPGSLPYWQSESASGSHALTRALLRAAVSQFSPEVKATWQPVMSTVALTEKLKSPFAKGEPVPVLINFSGGGHAMLAFNYQQMPSGEVDLDVVDPNVPFGEGGFRRPEAEAYPKLQVKVSLNGSWQFLGSFGATFGNPVSGGPGSLEVVPEPREPGGLLLPSSSLLAHLWTYIHPALGDTVSAIGYNGKSAHGIPSDAMPEPLFDDKPDNRLLVPARHHSVTATIASPAGSPASVNFTGFGFIDGAHLGSGQHIVTVGSREGALSVPQATAGTGLSVTRVIDGVQRTVNASFTGKVRGVSLSISSAGEVTLTTTSGNGHVSIRLATYMPNGETAKTRPEVLALHRHARVHRRTPEEVRHHRKAKHKHAGSKHRPR